MQSSGLLDGQGEYLIIHDHAAIRSDASLRSPIVGHLRAGDVVRVLTVVHRMDDRRVRGLIEYPEGWISLADMDHGYRWAQRWVGDAEGTEKAKLVVAIRQRDAVISELVARAEKLRAESHKNVQSFQERAREIEARLLSAQIVPVSDDYRPRLWHPSCAHAPAFRAERRGISEAEAVEAAAAADLSNLPPGSRVVAVRALESLPPTQAPESDAGGYLAGPAPPAEGEGDGGGGPAGTEAEPGRLDVPESYAPVQPSPWHVQGWRAQRDVLPNVYPINRTPVDVLYTDALRARLAGAYARARA